MKKFKIYRFINQKNPKIRKFLYTVLFLISIFISIILSNFLFKSDELIENKRKEIDPRKTINIDFNSLRKIETNELIDNFKIYFFDKDYIHIRNEKNLEYKSIVGNDIVDFSVFKNKSAILYNNRDLYYGDSELKKNTPILLNTGKGPEILTNMTYQYGENIIMFSRGILYSYNIITNSWKNISKYLNLELIDNIKFSKNYFVGIKENLLYVFDSKAFKPKKFDFENKIFDITYNEKEIYVLTQNKKVYKISVDNDFKKSEIFSQTAFIGDNIIGARLNNNILYLLTNRGINFYSISERKWQSIKIENVPIDFYINSDLLILITNDYIYKINLIKNNFKVLDKLKYEKFYHFNGKDFYYFKEGKLYTISGEKIFEFPKKGFKDFNPHNIKEVYYSNNKLFLLSDNTIYEYSFNKREYKIITNDYMKTIYSNNNIYYLLKNKELYKYDSKLEKSKLISNKVNDFDIFQDKIVYIRNDYVLSNGKKYFMGLDDFYLDDLMLLRKFDNRIILINENGFIIFNDENKSIEKKFDFNENPQRVKVFDNSNFAVIFESKILFINIKGDLIKTINILDNQIINDKGDYIVLKTKSNYEENYKFYDKSGNEISYKNKILPEKSIINFFALNDYIVFQYENGDVYTLNPKTFKVEVLPAKYFGKITNIKEVNGKYYCISENNLVEFYSKKIVEKDVKDFTSFNNNLLILKKSGYLLYNGDKLFLGSLSNAFNNKYITSSLYEENGKKYFVIIHNKGIEKINLSNFNIITLNKNIVNASFVNGKQSFIYDGNSLFLFDANNMNIIRLKGLKTNNYSFNKNKMYYKTNTEIKSIDFNKNEKVEKSFYSNNVIPNLKGDFKKVYYNDGFMYMFGDDFYAIYNINKLKWVSVRNNIKIKKVNYIENKVCAVINDQSGYFIKEHFDIANIPEFNEYTSYDEYFKNTNTFIDNIYTINVLGDYVFVVKDDGLLYYSNKLHSWNFQKISGIINAYNFENGVYIFTKSGVYKFKINNDYIDQKFLNETFGSYSFSDFIVLKNNNSYKVFNKELELVYNRNIYKREFNVLKDIYYIFGRLYFISTKGIYTEKNEKIVGSIKKYFYVDDKLYILINDDLYETSESETFKLIYENVEDFNIYKDKYIVLFKNGNVKTNISNFADYKIEGNIIFAYNDDNNIYLISENGYLYEYRINIHNISNYKKIINENKIFNLRLQKDIYTKDDYIVLESNTKFYVYKLNELLRGFYEEEKRFIFEFDKTNQKDAYVIVYNNKVYLMSKNKLISYSENKEIDTDKIFINKLINEKIELIYKINNIFYIRTKSGFYVMDKNFDIDNIELNDFKMYDFLNKKILKLDDRLYFDEKELKKANIPYKSNAYKLGNKIVFMDDKVVYYDGIFEKYDNFIMFDNFFVIRAKDKIRIFTENGEYDFEKFVSLIKNIKYGNKNILVDKLSFNESNKTIYIYSNSILPKKKLLISIKLNDEISNAGNIINFNDFIKNIFTQKITQIGLYYDENKLKILDKRSNSKYVKIGYYKYNNFYIMNNKEFVRDKIYRYTNIYEFSNKLILVNEKESFPYLTEINNYGGLVVTENGKMNYLKSNISNIIINGNALHNKIYFKNIILKKNQLLIKTNISNLYIDIDGKNHIIKENNDEIILPKEMQKLSYINIYGKKININKLRSKNGKLIFDSFLSVGLNYSNKNTEYYGITKDFGIIRINDGKYFKFNTKILKVFNNFNGKIILNTITEKYYTFVNDSIEIIDPNLIKRIDQEISFGENIIVRPLIVDLNNIKKIKFFDKPFGINDVYYNGLFDFEIPEQYVFNNGKILFQKYGIIYSYESLFKMVKILNTSFNQIGSIGDKLMDLNNYFKKYIVNIDLINSTISKKESNSNNLQINGINVYKPETEKIVRVITNEYETYIITQFNIYKVDNELVKIRKLDKKIIEAQSLLDKILVKTISQTYIYDPRKNIFEIYDQRKISIDLDNKKMYLDDFDVKIFNEFYDIKDLKVSNELFGLFKIDKIAVSNDKFYCSTTSNYLFEINNNKVNLLSIFDKIEELYSIGEKIIVNNSLAYENNNFVVLDDVDLNRLKGIYDILIDYNNYEIIVSEDEEFNIVKENKKENYNKLFFNTILGITELENTVYIVSDKGIFEISLNFTPYLRYEFLIDDVQKFYGKTVIKSKDRYYLIENKSSRLKLSSIDNLTLNNVVLLNNKYKLSNVFDKIPRIYYFDNNNMLDLTEKFFEKYILIKNGKFNNLILKNNNILIFTSDNIELYKVKNKCNDAYVKENNFIIETINGNYIIYNNNVIEYNDNIEFVNYSYDIFNKKLYISEKNKFLILGKELDNLKKLMPNFIYLDEKLNTNISIPEFGIFDFNFNKKILDKEILDKKRIEDKLYIKTVKKDIGYNFKNEIFIPKTKVIVNDQGIKFSIAKKFEFNYYGFSLEQLINNGTFDFDNLKKNFAINSKKIFVSSELGVWYYDIGFPKFLGKTLENKKVVMEKDKNKYKLKDIEESDVSLASSKKISITINSNFNFSQKVDTKTSINIEKFDKQFIDNTFIFDIPKFLYLSDKLWIINNIGIFSNNKIFNILNIKKSNFGSQDYLLQKNSYYTIEDFKFNKKENISYRMFDNKWYWNISVSKIEFENKFDKYLKRIYKMGYFADDIAMDIYLNGDKLYIKTQDNKLITYNNKYIVKMKNYENEKMEEFDFKNREINFYSRNYRYSYIKNEKYLNVEKISEIGVGK
ncbi:hypothetical protein [Marinitoga sp. 1155]|uniref:hypothetical protein n=1 Tax=Marinitoga sp. 1155 TaxID=1428448 RepID=UPI000640DF8C|nr:hypothetical protein [Marinitoga sp. 1155]KLO23524.1 hypothetical protein X274_06465 [Marinitoga sp. 1155]